MAIVNPAAPSYFDLQGLKETPLQDDSELRAAQQFEALFIQLWLKQMRAANAAVAGDSYLNSPAVEMHQQMLDQQWGVQLGAAGGLGLAEVIVRQMAPAQRAAPDAQVSTQPPDARAAKVRQQIAATLNSIAD